MSFNPIEGVDYIFDRYAYLKLEATATKDEIHKAVVRARAAVHTDRMQHVHADVVAKADTIRGLIDDCAHILEDDALRPLYTERLLDFRRNKPALVSDTGTPIVVLGAERADLEFLLRGDKGDFDEVKEKIRQMSGYSSKQTAAAKKLYDADPSEENRDFLESALTAKLVYYTVLEEAAWAAAGIQGFQKAHKGWLLDPADYIGQVEAEIKDRHDGLKAVVAGRNEALRIGVAAPLLLLTDQSGQGAEHKPGQSLSLVVLEQLTQKAQGVFSQRAALIREIAAEKQQVLTELVNVTFIQDLGLPLDTAKSYGLHLMRVDPDGGGEPSVLTSLQVDATGSIQVFAGDTRQLTQAGLAALGGQGCVIHHNKEISDIMLLIAHAANQYFKRRDEAEPARPESVAAAASGQPVPAEAPKPV